MLPPSPFPQIPNPIAPPNAQFFCLFFLFLFVVAKFHPFFFFLRVENKEEHNNEEEEDDDDEDEGEERKGSASAGPNSVRFRRFMELYASAMALKEADPASTGELSAEQLAEAVAAFNLPAAAVGGIVDALEKAPTVGEDNSAFDVWGVVTAIVSSLQMSKTDGSGQDSVPDDGNLAQQAVAKAFKKQRLVGW